MERKCRRQFHLLCVIGGGVFRDGGFVGLDSLTELGFFLELHAAEVVVGLKVDPELRLHFKEDAEGECRLGGDGATSFDDLSHAGGGDACAAGELRLRDTHRLQEFLQEDSAGCGGLHGFGFGCHAWCDLFDQAPAHSKWAGDDLPLKLRGIIDAAHVT